MTVQREPLSVDELPELVNVEEIQGVFRCGRSKAYEIARRYRVEGLGRLLRVRRTDVERLVRGESERPTLRMAK